MGRVEGEVRKREREVAFFCIGMHAELVQRTVKNRIKIEGVLHV
jgi:hypothetical protein